MSTISDEIDDALKEMERDMGGKKVTVAGVVYPCTPGNSELGEMLGAGGFSMSANQEFHIRRSLFGATLPTANKAVVFEGKNLKIAPNGVRPSSCGAFVIITCNDASQAL